MTEVRPPTAATPRAQPSHASPPALAPRGAPLLSDAADLTTAMYAIQLARRDAQQKQASSEVDVAKDARDHEIGLAREAVRQAEEAAQRAQENEESASFWGKVSAVTGIAVSLVTMGVGTAACVLVGTVLSSHREELEASLGKTGGTLAWMGGSALAVGGSIETFEELSNSENACFGVPLLAAANDAAYLHSSAKKADAERMEAHEGALAIERRADATAHRAEVVRSQTDIEGVADEIRALEASVRRAINTVLATAKDIEQQQALLTNAIGRKV